MKMGLYAVLDKVAGVGNIMTLNNDMIAKRSFINAVRSVKNDGTPNVFQQNPEDYVLVKLGTIDYQTGGIEPKYEEIIEAIDIVNNKIQKEDINENGEKTAN